MKDLTREEFKERLKNDPEFLQLFTLRLEGLKEKLDWEGRLPATLRDAMDAMQRCFKELTPADPQSLEALTKAMLVMADVALSLR